MDIINKKIDIFNYPDKNDFIYNMYLFYDSYIKICDFLETKNESNIGELKQTASESLNFIKNILTHIGTNINQDISIIMNSYIDNFKTKISTTTTDDFLKKINDNTITQNEFNEQKGLLLSQKIKPSSDDKFLIYEFLFKLNKDESSITVVDIDNIQNNDEFKLNAYKYLLMKLLIDKDEDITSFIDDKDVNKIRDKLIELSSMQTGGTIDTNNNIFNAYMIMVMNKIMEMDNSNLAIFNKNLKTIEA